MKKLVAVLVALVALIFLLACGDAEDAQTPPDHNATAQAILATTPTKIIPTSTPTLVHQVTDIITHHHPDDDYSKIHGVITGAACDAVGVCHVDETTRDVFERKDDIQVDCYAIFDALYNSSMDIQQLTVNIFGNVVDKYGNTSKAVIATAVLTKQTEEKFNWKGLQFWTAWDVYDQADYLLNG